MPSRQALILIHGIGEQRPMETLRKFVDAVWTQDTDIQHQFAVNNVWSKPDTVSKSFELRRLTTSQNRAGIRTDFFEFYWAHLMKGTTIGHVLGWARALLIRRPSTVPDHLKLAYWVLVGVAIVAVGFAGYAAYARGGDKQPFGPAWLSAAISLVLLPALGFVLKSIVGDAARYLDAAPANVQRRHEIRHAGVELLKALHQRDYDRIIVVGHSLGSVIGYDILTHAWVDFHSAPPLGNPTTAAHSAPCRCIRTTRWTNLYFPGCASFDLSKVGFFSHTLYWLNPDRHHAPAHIQELREALDLVDDRRA